MSQYSRSKPEGRRHRAKLRVLLVPELYVGARLPSASFLARMLEIGPSEALRHMRRVCFEDGIALEKRGKGPACRLYVTAMPERRVAA